ncbi:MAG: thioesterase domain-containing protein [Bacteroidota bacterium]|nr:thioesterase domain-containing protein [Bacteroidota bacterium]
MDLTNNNTQLFMLHFGGGNRYSFQFIKPYLPVNFDFQPIELPGRGKRINEPLLSTEQECVNDLFSQIISLRNKRPYLIYGHSMGASLGLRITKRLEEIGDPPKRLIVSGNAGPGTGSNKRRSQMNDEELKEELRLLGGVSEEVLSNDDLFNFFSPIMRSDFKLLENSEKLGPDFMIKSSIVAIMGDKEETSGEIENWKNFSLGEFKFHLLPGNHFFIHDHPVELMKIIKNAYDRPLVS